MSVTIRVACPGCGAAYNLPAASAGKNATCKRCDVKFTVTAVPPVVLPEPEMPPVGTVIPRAALASPPARAVAAVSPFDSDFDAEPARPRRNRVEVEHRQAGRFGNGFLTALGCFAAAALVGTLGVLFVCGGGMTLLGVGSAERSRARDQAKAAAAAGPSAAVAGQEPTKPAEPGQAPAPVIFPDWQTPVVVGDISVRVVKTVVGEVDIVGSISSKKTVSQDELVAITVTVSNTGKDKKVNYKTWAAGDFSFSSDDRASLKDEHGNGYKYISFGFSRRAAGGIDRDESIYPGKHVSDVVVFESPVKTAQFLTLTLPCKNFGGEGVVTFRIPTATAARR